MFAVSFIVIFSAIVSTIPIDLQGQEAEPIETVIPINPNLLTDFANTKQFDRTNFIVIYGLDYYTYEIVVDSTTFEAQFDQTDAFSVGAHTLWIGIWLGGYDWANFINDNGTNYGTSVSFDDIDNDADNGVVRYTLTYETAGASAGGFIFSWNTTTYTGSSDAWDSSKLYLIHGQGLTADTNIASLLLSLLFLQIPDIPFLVNIILVTPLWACIIYVTWFIIKSMIPLLG